MKAYTCSRNVWQRIKVIKSRFLKIEPFLAFLSDLEAGISFKYCSRLKFSLFIE